jgi:hypothetical protein
MNAELNRRQMGIGLLRSLAVAPFVIESAAAREPSLEPNGSVEAFEHVVIGGKDIGHWLEVTSWREATPSLKVRTGMFFLAERERCWYDSPNFMVRGVFSADETKGVVDLQGVVHRPAEEWHFLRMNKPIDAWCRWKDGIRQGWFKFSPIGHWYGEGFQIG